jgi:hypothetical protein
MRSDHMSIGAVCIRRLPSPDARTMALDAMMHPRLAVPCTKAQGRAVSGRCKE